jgi:hypothetical protein
MHFSTMAAAVSLGLLAFAAGSAAVLPPLRADQAAAAAPAGGTGAATSAAASGDAAAKHARRTACLKEAKTKKLLGAQKTTFIRNCTAAP